MAKSYRIETASITHLNRADFENIYEPREDSFMLIDTLEQQLPEICKLKPQFIAEIGCGTGIVIVSLAKALQKYLSSSENVCYFATDLNRFAVKASVETALKNSNESGTNTIIQFCRTSFLDGFRANLFDLVIFNPPYVPCEWDEVKVNNRELEYAWSGGPNCGRAVIDQFLARLGDYLSADGVCFLVVLRDNNVEDIRRMAFENFHLVSSVINERKILGEHLYVLKIQKN